MTTGRRLRSWIAGNVPIVLTLLGLWAYAVVMLSYRSFYSRLGVDVREVGLGGSPAHRSKRLA